MVSGDPQVGKGAYLRLFDLKLIPRGWELDGEVVKSPPLSPPPTGGGRWGSTLIGALHIFLMQDSN